MAYRPSDFPIFTRIDRNTVNRMMTKIIKYLGNLSSVLKIKASEIIESDDVLLEIIERVEKRRVYFHVFYDGCQMGELNEGALLCFWIAKLQPFHHPKIPSSTLNAKIGLYLLQDMLNLMFHQGRFNMFLKAEEISF